MTAVNDVPSISSIVNQTVEANTATLAIPFTVADVETPGTGLVVSGSSSQSDAGSECECAGRWQWRESYGDGDAGGGPVGHVDDHADGE